MEQTGIVLAGLALFCPLPLQAVKMKRTIL